MWKGRRSGSCLVLAQRGAVGAEARELGRVLLQALEPETRLPRELHLRRVAARQAAEQPPPLGAAQVDTLLEDTLVELPAAERGGGG